MIIHLRLSFPQPETGRNRGQSHPNPDARESHEGRPQGGAPTNCQSFPAKRPISSRRKQQEFATAHFSLHRSQFFFGDGLEGRVRARRRAGHAPALRGQTGSNGIVPGQMDEGSAWRARRGRRQGKRDRRAVTWSVSRARPGGSGRGRIRQTRRGDLSPASSRLTKLRLV